MRAESSILLLQSLAEFANVAIRKAKIRIDDIRRTIDAWCAVLRIQTAEEDDLKDALEAMRAHRLVFWDVMLCASARRAGVQHFLTEGLQDGFVLQGVSFVNPFKLTNERVIDGFLPPN